MATAWLGWQLFGANQRRRVVVCRDGCRWIEASPVDLSILKAVVEFGAVYHTQTSYNPVPLGAHLTYTFVVSIF